MPIIQRVRAILVKDHELYLIRRVREGRAPYWVAPGGGVEAADASLEVALQREIHEEIAGKIDILKLVFTLAYHHDPEALTRESYFLCTLLAHDFAARNGPEFTLPGRGEYHLDAIALTKSAVEKRNIQPEALKLFLADHIDQLFLLPDLR